MGVMKQKDILPITFVGLPDLLPSVLFKAFIYILQRYWLICLKVLISSWQWGGYG